MDPLVFYFIQLPRYNLKFSFIFPLDRFTLLFVVKHPALELLAYMIGPLVYVGGVSVAWSVDELNPLKAF